MLIEANYISQHRTEASCWSIPSKISISFSTSSFARMETEIKADKIFAAYKLVVNLLLMSLCLMIPGPLFPWNPGIFNDFIRVFLKYMIQFPHFFCSLPILGTESRRSISPQPTPNCTPSGLEKYQLEVALEVATDVHKDRTPTQRDHGRRREEPTVTHALGAGARCSPAPGRQSPGSNASGAGGSSGEKVLSFQWY